MMKLLGQMLKLPITALVYSMEMFVKTLHGLQKIANENIDTVVGDSAQAPGDMPVSSYLVDETPSGGINQCPGNAPENKSILRSDTKTFIADDSFAGSRGTTYREEKKMPDTNLSDDTLKLIRYKILFVKRDYEVAFPEAEELVYDNLTGTAYTAWKVAEFIQNLKPPNNKTHVPGRWGDKYPNDKDDKGNYKFKSGDLLTGFPEDDKKYLRVYYEVLERYPREKLYYEDRQLEVLEDIAHAIREDKTAGKQPVK